MAREHYSESAQCHGPDAGDGRRFAARHRTFTLNRGPIRSKRSGVQLVGALLLLLSPAAAGTALSITETSSDSIPYGRRVWQSADGLPEDFVQALARTRDGYLW